MEIKSLNEVYKLSDEDLYKYESDLFVHYKLVSDEIRRREKEKEGK